jgi:hypothetical protein
MSTRLLPSSRVTKTNESGRIPSDSKQRRRSNASEEWDEDFDWNSLGHSPENAISEQVGGQAFHPPIPSAIQPAVSVPVPLAAPSEESDLSPFLQSRTLGLTPSVPPTYTSPEPAALSLTPCTNLMPQLSGTGIYRKVIEVWRVQPPTRLHDEEAAHAPLDIGKIRALELRRDWKQVVTGEETTCVVNAVRDTEGGLRDGPQHHVSWV